MSGDIGPEIPRGADDTFTRDALDRKLGQERVNALRNPRNQEEVVLFNLSQRYEDDRPTPIALIDGIRLIDRVTEDKTKEGAEFGDRLEYPQALEYTRSALLKVSEGRYTECTVPEMRIARGYLKWKKSQWTESPGDVLPHHAKNIRRVYDDLLRKLNERLPVPESVILDPPPDYDFGDPEAILSPLMEDIPGAEGKKRVKKTLTPEDVKACFENIQSDVQNEFKKARSGDYQLATMQDAITQARETVIARLKRAEPLARINVVVLKPNETNGATDIEVQPYERDKQYPQLRDDGSRQFILDLAMDPKAGPFEADHKYVEDFDNFSALLDSAGSAADAIDGLMQGYIGASVYSDVDAFRERLKRTDKIKDPMQKFAAKKLIRLLDQKLGSARILRVSEAAQPEVN